MLYTPCESLIIPHMRVSIQPIKRGGSKWYLAGSWREATPYFNVMNLDKY